MKSIITILISAALIIMIMIPKNAEAEVTDSSRVNMKQSPCDDSLYIKLKKMELSEMNKKEQDYFKKLNSQCKAEKKKERKSDQRKALTVLIGIVTVIGVLFLVGVSLGGWGKSKC